MSAADISRAIPQSIESEQAVIGALLFDNDAIDRIGELKTEHFYRGDHRAIFSEITKLIGANRPADVFTVFESLGDRAVDLGGMQYLDQLARNVPGSANIARYAEIVRDRAMKRGLSSLGSMLQDMAFNPDGASAAELAERAYAQLEAFSANDDRDDMVGIESAMTEYVELLDRQHEGQIVATPTGFTELDDKLDGGMNGGDLIIVGARPSMGKTAFAMGIGRNVAEGKAVGVFSMEMPRKQLMRRLVASLGGIPMGILGDPRRMSDEHWPKLTHAMQRAKDLQFFIDDRPARTLGEIRARCRTLKRKHGLGLVIVDYLGLMGGGEGDNRTQQVGANSRGLKVLAKELDVPVIVLAQLNRGLESRPNKRPMMSDLRDSGEIEQDADTVMFLYRDEVYNPDSPDKGVCEIIIAKQRNGETGHIALGYQGMFTRFTDIDVGREYGRRPEPTKRSRGFEG
ncbi:replicative DNA helicase [Pandoraea sp. XJJ-1]|uniref:replicative DNA helicase n=1 Tax=Pandoraea sp. XJJ-1 TaxID=3002643 RepID=UPI0022823112|nr:replicative DNA helicase [Pandoraea sp. XJJ-1]WAL80971.1 replicative DNA helicase [Pandoraea sp. XJJ-1]